jgi:hypothetical protein
VRTFKEWNLEEGSEILYQGEVDRNDKYDGKGIQILKSNCVILGHWKRGLKHGP